MSQKHQDDSPITILTDDIELEPTEEFKQIANTISRIISGSHPKFTIGIYGEWGTGKSTLMTQIRDNLKKTENNSGPIPTTWFNAWRFEREENHATIPLMLTIIARLYEELSNPDNQVDSTKIEDFRNKVRKFFSGWNVSLTFPIPLAGEVSISKEFGEKTEEDLKNIPKSSLQVGLDLIKSLNGQLKIKSANGLKLVVFIDDLDRCSPKKAIQVLESIKITLDIDGLVYVIGLSDQTVAKLITQEYEKSGVKGEHYIRKIIQIPVRIPLWQPDDVVKLLREVICKKIPDNKLLSEDTLELISICAEPNPREIKRFTNNLILSKENYKIPESKNDELIVIETMKSRWNKFYNFFSLDREFRTTILELTSNPVGTRETILRVQKNPESKQHYEGLAGEFLGFPRNHQDSFLQGGDELWIFLSNSKIKKIIQNITDWKYYLKVTKTFSNFLNNT